MAQATNRQKDKKSAEKRDSDNSTITDEVATNLKIGDKPQEPADPKFDQGNRSTSRDSLEEWSPGADVPKT
ncbi:MAG: hypothetical protein ABI539_01770 [Acidobacteriota bacterium]